MACEEVVKRFSDSDEPEIQCWIATALINKSMIQIQTGDADEPSAHAKNSNKDSGHFCLAKKKSSSGGE